MLAGWLCSIQFGEQDGSACGISSGKKNKEKKPENRLQFGKSGMLHTQNTPDVLYGQKKRGHGIVARMCQNADMSCWLANITGQCHAASSVH